MVRCLIPKIVVLYKSLTHSGVQSNLQETIKLKAKMFISKLKAMMTSDYFQFHAFPGEGKQIFRTFRVEGCPKLEHGGRWQRGDRQASQRWWTRNTQSLSTKLNSREMTISTNSSQRQRSIKCNQLGQGTCRGEPPAIWASLRKCARAPLSAGFSACPTKEHRADLQLSS